MNTILHLGVGNFHRAHQAWYTHAANASTATLGADATGQGERRDAEAPWRIIGVSLRSAGVRDALEPDRFAYTLAIGDADGETLHRIDVIEDVLVVAEDPEAVVAAIADESVSVITLTVTEKGYELAADHRLALDSARVKADIEALRTGRAPVTTIGLLAAGLARRAGHAEPVTVLSCDNLPGNGQKLGDAVRMIAGAAGLVAAPFSAPAVAFPSSMVDRITPATDAALRDRVASSNHPSASPVATEAFTEWVIEDRFAGARPAWESAGAVFADDVEPFEQRKLRMLNGAHSYLAYAGTLAGHAFVHEAIADPELRAGARAVMDEAAVTLPPIVRADSEAYADALLERFANPGLAHRLRQIAMDGSLKLPIRLLDTREARAAAGQDSPACDAALAAWRAFLVAEFEAGRTVDDPAADRLRRGIDRGDDVFSLLERSA